MTYRFFIFDLDGTLIDSYRALTTAINRTGRALLDQPLSEEAVRGLVGEGVERLLQKAFGLDLVDPSLATQFEDEYERVCCEESSVLGDVEATLQQLHAAGIAMAVCTNKPTRFSEQILEHLRLRHFFGAVVGPDLAGARKPDPRHVLDTLERIGGSADQTLFIGDMPIDIDAARAANIAVAAVATGSATAEELQRRRPDFFLDRFTDLLAIIEEPARSTP